MLQFAHDIATCCCSHRPSIIPLHPPFLSQPHITMHIAIYIFTLSTTARTHTLPSPPPTHMQLTILPTRSFFFALPQLVFVPPDFSKYTAASAVTRRVFAQYDPSFSAASLDEAALDVTAHCAVTGQSGEQVHRGGTRRWQAAREPPPLCAHGRLHSQMAAAREEQPPGSHCSCCCRMRR